MIHHLEDASQRLAHPLMEGIKTAPFEYLIATFAAVWSSLALHTGGIFVDHAPEVLTACALSLIGAFILSALHQFGGIEQRERLIATALICALFGAMSGLVLNLRIETNVWRVGLLASALICVIPLTSLARRDDEESMSVWRFTLNLTNRVTVALAYAFAMQAAISIAFVALEELFELSMSPDEYAQIAIVLFIAFAPTFVASGLTSMATESSIADSLSKSMLERAGKWLVAPALVAYLLIIYIYTAKVVAAETAPENLLSPLALGAATLGLAAIFFFEPMVRRERPDWFSHFVRWLPLGLLAGLPLATWAIWQRIDQHGWTEFRYFRLLLVLGFGLTFFITPFLRTRRKQFVLRAGPAIFGILFALASIGPFSASSVSRNSQLAYLRDDLHAVGIDLRGGIDDEALGEAPDELRRSVASRIRYLRDKHGDETLSHLVGQRDVDEILTTVQPYGHPTTVTKVDVPTYADAQASSPLMISRPSRVVGAKLYPGGSADEMGWQFSLTGDLHRPSRPATGSCRPISSPS